MRIAILAAFENELAAIKKQFPNTTETMISKCRCLTTRWKDYDITLSLTGIGTSAAAISTTILCERLEPELIIFCGVAGGLKAEQQIGDLIIANKIIDADLHQLPILLHDSPYKNAFIDPHTLLPIVTEDLPSNAILNLISSFSFKQLEPGILVTSNIFPAPQSMFAQIKNLKCSAIEMESTAVVKAARYYDVPVICLRAISNLLDSEGNDLGTKPDALEICAARLALCLDALLAHIAKNRLLILNEKLEK